MANFRSGWLAPLPIQKIQYRSRQLVGSMGTGLLRNQSSQTILLDGGLGLIKRGPRESGFVRRQADRGLFGLDPPQHLVLDLDQIVGIEEAVVLEQRRSDRFGVRVQDTLLAEQAAFGILGRVHM